MGYSFTGASSISAALGDGDKALEYLEGLYPFLLPNGMYKEAGPVMETPLSAAQCIHDMLIQSWGGVVRVMPALPSTWQDLRFDRLRTEGAFEVSAIREGGKIKKVTITSLAGEPLRVEPGLGSDIIAERESSTEMLHSDDGRFSLELNKGESVTLSTAT